MILAALRRYVADHPRVWNVYTDAFTYAYNCQPYTPTIVALFELVLFKPTRSIALKLMPLKQEPKGDSKQNRSTAFRTR